MVVLCAAIHTRPTLITLSTLIPHPILVSIRRKRPQHAPLASVHRDDAPLVQGAGAAGGIGRQEGVQDLPQQRDGGGGGVVGLVGGPWHATG